MVDNEREAVHTGGTGVDARLARHGGLSYLEIPAIDAGRSADFYERVVGWRITGRDSGDPRFSDATGHLIGRWRSGSAINREPGMMVYMYVNKLDTAIDGVSSSGGEVVKPPYPEGNLWIATVRDPAGNVIGLWQQGPR